MRKIIKEDLEEQLITKDNNSCREADEFAIKELNRKEKIREHFSWILIAFLWIASAAILFMVMVWFWHFLCPDEWRYLSTDRFHEVQNILFAGLISQAIPYVNSYLKKQG